MSMQCSQHSHSPESLGGTTIAVGGKETWTDSNTPYANAYAERWVRNVREECLDHLLVFNERHLNHVLTEYSQYYSTPATPSP